MTKNMQDTLLPFTRFRNFPSILSSKALDDLWESLSGTGCAKRFFDTYISVPYDVIVVKDDDCNIIKTEISYAVAGYSKDEVHVDCNEDSRTLTVTVDPAKSCDDTTREYVVKGLKHSYWNASYSLGDNVDMKGINATMKDGILTVSIPLKKEKNNSSDRNICISVQ